MKTTKPATWTALLLLGSALPARADETPPELSPLHVHPPQDPEQEEAIGWDGEVPNVEWCLERIAEAEVLMTADGDYAQAEELLDEVWVKATAVKGFEGQTELLVRIALARADLYHEQGQQEKALDATKRLYLRPQDLASLRVQTQLQMRKVDPALWKSVVEAANDPRLLKLRKQILEQRESSDHDSLAEIVRDAYAKGEYRVIVEIGAPAQPAFAAEIVADAETFPPSINEDPLIYLLQMNEGRAAEILLTHLDAGGYLWKRRVVRAMDVGDVMTNSGTWSSGEPFVCLEPEWLEVLEALLSSPDTALQSVHLVEEPFLRDAFTPGITAALIRGIETYDLDFVNALLTALDHGGVVESALPVFEAAAGHPDAQVKRFAARVLTHDEANEVLKELAHDEDPEVRVSVVRTLQPHRGRYLEREQIQNGVWGVRKVQRSFHPSLGEAERALLAGFSRDPSADVRRGVAQALASLEVPLDDEVYLRLARDTDSSVRLQMAYITDVDATLRSRILRLLADDKADFVVSVLDDVLQQAPLESDPAPYLEALRLRLTDRRFVMEEGSRNRVVDKLVVSPRGLQAVVAWTLAGEDRSLQDLLFERLQRHGFERILALDDANLGGLFARAHDYAGGGQSHYFNNVRGTIETASPSRREAMRAVLRDDGYDVAVRLNAATLAAPDGGPSFQEDLLTLITAEYWQANVATAGDLSTFFYTVMALPAVERNGFVLRVVRDTTVQDALARKAAEAYATTGPQSREVMLAILERWFDPDGLFVQPVEQAIEHMVALPDDADPALLQAAALHPHYARAAVQTMIALRKPAFLPILARCMEAEWVPDDGARKRVRYDAVAGISCYLSDEAAEILLRGLTSSDPQVRRMCAEGLDHIEATALRYQRWQELGQAQPTRESALAELVRMIEDDSQEVRIQAIRGIATFGAIEYLPLLIRLLDDRSREVVKAARASIDELNRNAEPPGEAGSPDEPVD